MSTLSPVLALLRAAHFLHQSTHWTVRGSNFFADHQLFDLLYNALPEEIDTLAEKMVNQAGEDSVNPATQVAMMHQSLGFWLLHPDPIQRAIQIERDIQEAVVAARKSMSEQGLLTVGLDNFLAGLADSHEKALYLLGQRSKTAHYLVQKVASRYLGR